jgi:hypothetical protein
MTFHTRGEEELALARFEDWGIYRVPWLWGERLKILFVIDGGIDVSTNGFGLGKVIDILHDPSFAWWVDFEVHVAERGPTPPAGPHPVAYLNFRFNQLGFDLSDYDQVWLFGFQPGNDAGPDANIANGEPLTDAELKILAEWMDAGGGVLAAGDHDYLGASMCSRIPRVRTMRKWTNAQGVPPIDGPTRLDTNQPATSLQRVNAQFMPFALQGDAVPQPIDVVLEPLWHRTPWIRGYAPHPILCTRAGIIEVFPDHPHEGEIIDDDDVELDKPVGISGFGGVEYPGGAGRPRPKVIAYGRSTHQQWNRVKGLLASKRFGLVGTYDGDSAGVGRVVVDSTWHHWFSENLVGFEASNPDVMNLMRAYFRNVALWLATPAQRANMLAAATWGVVVGSGPMEFPPTASIFQLGERARDVIGRTATQCTIREWIDLFFDFVVFEPIRIEPDPCLTCPPWEAFETAIIGGIAKRMVDVAFPMQQEMSFGRRTIPNPKEIASAASEGARLGHRELVRLLGGGRARSDISRAVSKSFKRVRLHPPDLRLTQIRIAVKEVQLTDPFDPALADDAFQISVSLVLDGVEVASVTSDAVEVPEFGARGGRLRLDQEIGELTVWRGSVLTVLLTSTPPEGGQPKEGTLRGAMTFDGDPSEWIGSHRPSISTSDSWRMMLEISGSGSRGGRTKSQRQATQPESGVTGEEGE